MQHAVFAAFFVIQHELHGDARAPGPLRVGRVAAIADEVAGIRKRGIVGVHEGMGTERWGTEPWGAKPISAAGRGWADGFMMG
ncbi:hypothetical protein D3C87_1889940 [compost metagenome]